MVAMEVSQTLAWPNPCVYMPINPTDAKARPVSAAGALVDISDISQVLNLGSCQWRCNSAFHAAMRRDFSSSSLVTQLLELSCGFSHSSGGDFLVEELSVQSWDSRVGSGTH